MSDHLAVLQVLVPLLAAPLCALIGRRKIVHGLTLAACGVTFAIAIALAMRVATSGAFSYYLGAGSRRSESNIGWTPSPVSCSCWFRALAQS